VAAASAAWLGGVEEAFAFARAASRLHEMAGPGYAAAAAAASAAVRQ
jgi:predicted ATPase